MSGKCNEQLGLVQNPFGIIPQIGVSRRPVANAGWTGLQVFATLDEAVHQNFLVFVYCGRGRRV